MKKEIIEFRMPKLKHRAHYALFAEDSPFKPKVVQRKDLYKHKPKHKKEYSDYWQ